MDLSFTNHGSLFLVRGHTQAGQDWLNETAPEDAQFLGDAMAVEPRCVEGVVQAAEDAGLTVS